MVQRELAACKLCDGERDAPLFAGYDYVPICGQCMGKHGEEIHNLANKYANSLKHKRMPKRPNSKKAYVVEAVQDIMCNGHVFRTRELIDLVKQRAERDGKPPEVITRNTVNRALYTLRNNNLVDQPFMGLWRRKK